MMLVILPMNNTLDISLFKDTCRSSENSQFNTSGNKIEFGNEWCSMMQDLEFKEHSIPKCCNFAKQLC